MKCIFVVINVVELGYHPKYSFLLLWKYE